MIEIIYVTAPWCGPCKYTGPILEQVANQTGAQLTKIDADENPEFLQERGIYSIPTVLIQQEGVTRHRVVGAKPINIYLDLIGELNA